MSCVFNLQNASSSIVGHNYVSPEIGILRMYILRNDVNDDSVSYISR